MKMPQDIGPVHFVGIGGIGMSGIAEVLHMLGYTVKGSDLSESANVKRLREKGRPRQRAHAKSSLGFKVSGLGFAILHVGFEVSGLGWASKFPG